MPFANAPLNPLLNSSELSRRNFTLGTVASLLLTACGGGGVDIAGISTGGTGSFSSGAVRGFGSIIVNGVRFDDSRASSVTSDDGVSVSNSTLRLGMVVEVNGGAITTDATGAQIAVANTIGIRSEIKGPVSAINAGTITVLGQQIQIGAGTVFDDSIAGGLAGLAVNDVVEVYGLLVSPGVYNATRVERMSAPTAQFKLRGVVANLNTTNKTFSLGSTVVNYGAITPSVTLSNGLFVKATLAAIPNSSGQYLASAITGSSTLNAITASGVETEIEGYVTSFTSTTSFSVNGVPVDARTATKTPASGLVLGAEVEVNGTVQNGVLVAREVKLETSGDTNTFTVKGLMSSLNTTNKTFVVRGVTVNYTSATFTRGSAGALANGQTIEAKGILGSDNVTLVASEVKIEG